MIKMTNRHKLNENAQQIFNIFEAYNVASSIMETEPVELRLMEMADSQSILGQTFRVNIYNDGRLSIIINQTDTYDEVMKTESAIKDLVDPFYTLEIDGRSKPVVAKFRIDLPTLEDGKAFVGRMVDIIQLK